jgi:iron(III) transport system ATP-binding protein
MLFQDFALFPHLSVVDNVSFGVDAPDRRPRALDLLGRLGMADYAAAFPHTLSGGQQQRVALARALAPRPSLMLLDEPFSGIDARLRGVLRDETLHLLKGSGVAAVMVTHDAEEAMFMADRIAVMRRGRIVQVGTPAELYRHPRSAFVAEFFGEVNRIPAVVQGGAAPTPFGALPTALADGTRAEVLIRPEALVPVSGAQLGAVSGRVIAARMLGRTTLIHLEIAGPDGAQHLHARVRGDISVAENGPIWLELDRRAAVVLPLTDSDDDTTT